MNRFLKLLVIIICLLAVAALLFKFANEKPDPIEAVLQNSEKEGEGGLALFSDYQVPCIHSKFLTGILVVVLGAGLSAGIFYLVLKKMAPHR
jgi:ATP/ADP translocase